MAPPADARPAKDDPLAKRNLRGPFLFFAILTILLGGAVWYHLGETPFYGAAHEGLDLFLFVLPRFMAGLLFAGFFLALVPRDFVARWIGETSGMTGILMGTLAGTLTPGGPMMAWPVVVALLRAGADKGPLVAYITAWEMLGIQRSVVWDLPLLGGRFFIIKTIASIAMPILAGLIAANLPINIRPTDPEKPV
jgi:uncharacterized membrane protein YraQ (UPF0718 family)